MPRCSQMYWKTSHNAFYTRIKGRLIRLGVDRREAQAEFHRLMLADDPTTLSRLTVAELVDAYLDDAKDRIKAVTWDTYRDHLQSWVHQVGRLRGRDVRPLHVSAWLKAHPAWCSSTRHLAVSVVKLWSRWCQGQGYLDRDPLAAVKRPTLTRRSPPAPGAIATLRGGRIKPEFRDYLELALLTGCRPGELRTLEARQCDLSGRKATVTGKTGPRAIVLSQTAVDLLSRLCACHPEGPVLRNCYGGPWTARALQNQFDRWSQRLGVKLVAYQLRGAYATEALRRGVDSLLISRLLGHKDPSILARHYANPDDAMLRNAAEKASKSG